MSDFIPSKLSGINHYQSGISLLILVFALLIVASTFFLSLSTAESIKNEHEVITQKALIEAKNALLGYAATQNLALGGCAANCPRPGDMPCPDINNDGVADTPCNSQSSRLGRLPWKTLSLGDLRDGNGDRLWYAVSIRYKKSPRAFPLNSDTLGTITIRDNSGNIVQDANAGSGAVAVVFSPGPPLVRQDTIQQSRSTANENNPIHYLDNALGEDNADFIDSSPLGNGFIKGTIHDAAGAVILNDQLLILTKADIMNAIEPRVAAEVTNALLDYYCGLGNADYRTKTCVSIGGNLFYPSPANFSDSTCLGAGSIGVGLCLPNDLINHGRVPVNPVPDWQPTSPLLGLSNNNWFQQNGWRELVYYARAPACVLATPSCSGVGILTLIGAASPSTVKNVIAIATGSAIGTQIRLSNSDKTLESNYLEQENLLPLDDTYLRMLPRSVIFNDFSMSVP